MLTDITKRKINSLRDILVGVVPSPEQQVNQITNALIYKYMDDMDRQSEKLGGKASFFVGKYAKYAWRNLMDPKLGGQERMNRYVEALETMGTNKNLSSIFRDILKEAFLPYRSPEILNLFLSEIDGFHYDHSEELGNAFEYLLSIMGSQGDAGQFRTPRHIIDFIVAVVDPEKGQSILDPACGTAGFLISAYKHILAHNSKGLKTSELKHLHENIVGYDINPDMTKFSRVNMFLHNFPEPQIHDYDTLSREERWSENYDIILANPPFMTPKGGIVPHKKFSISANRSEVLFVDYILEHLKPKGRAGIIVPEGVIFQSGSAYKALRKALVEDGLYAVASLPAGAFNPYSGVKTSVLFFDREIGKRSDEILFVKIEKDGYDLGAQRRQRADLDDLPQAIDEIKEFREAVINKTEFPAHGTPLFLSHAVKRIKIAETGDYNLTSDSYRAVTDYSNAQWPMVKFDDAVSTITPPIKILKEHFRTEGRFPIIDQSQNEIAGWTDDETTLVKSKKPLVIFGDHTCAVKYAEKSFAQGADGIKILLTNDQLIPKYFYYILKTKPVESEGYQRHFAKLKRYKIPLPPLDI
jgi:type I restriction enzyme M protein